MRRIRPLALAFAAVVATSALSGCTQIQPVLHQWFPEQFGPYRGDDGQVTADTDAAVKYLQVNDCFDFPKEPDESRALIKPCAEDHTFRVLAIGDVSLLEQQTIGVQNAISAKCKDPFDAWAATMPVDKPKDQKFLVRDADDGTQVKVYTCIAALQKL